MTVATFWQEFITAKNLDPSAQYYSSFFFCSNEELANKLLALVLSGKKTATTSSFLSYEPEGERLPQAGDYSIVTDFEGNPHCVIETTAVTILRFNEMTYDICKREGEDDTLESWREGHRKFFKQDADELGYEFSEDMPVVFQDFKVVFRRHN
ncbi:MAG: ASCH domain-containing protein [Defluviitaleaceae bacterium]|nr:ASCH domain-containing protein [Defluviitaleaceae bacterium]